MYKKKVFFFKFYLGNLKAENPSREKLYCVVNLNTLTLQIQTIEHSIFNPL